MRRISNSMPRLATVATWALTLCASLSLALPTFAQPQPTPVRGADSAKLAAEGALNALKSQNLETLKNLVTDDHQAAFDNHNRVLFGCVRVAEFTLQSTTESGTSAVANFSWKATVDVERLLNAAVDHYRKTALAEGQSQDDVTQMVATLRQVFQLRAEAFKMAVERAEHKMTLVQEQGRWFVLELIDLGETDKQGDPKPEPDESTAGGSTPKELAERVLKGWQKANFDDLVYCMAPGPDRDMFKNNQDRSLILSLKLKKFELGDVKLNEGDDTAKITYKWDMQFDERKYMELQNKRSEEAAKQNLEDAKKKGAKPEELKALEERNKKILELAKQQARAQAAMWKQHLEKKQHIMTVKKHGDNERWYVMQPVEMPDMGGGGDKQGDPTAQENMQAPQHANQPSAKSEGVVFPGQVLSDFLTAWVNGKFDAMRSAVAASAQFDANLELIKHINVKSFELAEAPSDPGTAATTVTIAFTWSATFSATGFSEYAKTQMLQLAQKSGRAVNLELREEIDAAVDEYVDRIDTAVSTERHELTLVKSQARWQITTWPFALGTPPGTPTGGGATPTEAAQAFLKHWQAQEKSALAELMTPQARETFTAFFDALLATVRVKTFTLGTVTDLDGLAQAPFSWSAEFDAERYVKVSVAQALSASGAEGDEREQMERELLGSYRQAAADWTRHIGQAKHVMTLEHVGGRWFVVLPLEPIEPDIPGGAATAEAALSQFEAALRHHDVAAIEALLLPALRDMAGLAEFITVKQWTVGAWDTDNAEVVCSVEIATQLAFELEKFVAAEMGRMATLNHWTDAKAKEMDKELRPAIEKTAAAVKARVEAATQRITLQRIGGKWFIADAILWSPDGIPDVPK